MAAFSDPEKDLLKASGFTEEFDRYWDLLRAGTSQIHGSTDEERKYNELLMAPLFSFRVRENASLKYEASELKVTKNPFPQYGVLGQTVQDESQPEEDRETRGIMLNTNSPWSAFICGSQGSGKSYTLSRMLENCLVKDNGIGKLDQPLAGIVFNQNHHFDSICEAAYLCTAGVKVKVKVLVSPSSEKKMRTAYTNTLGNNKNLEVAPLLLRDSHITADRMMMLMAFGDNPENPPLYAQVRLS
jgi:hypothetical protein